MHLIDVTDAAALAERAADLVAAQIERRPASLLALPTGRTPLALYETLMRRARAGRLSLGRVRLVNLDEYRGLAPEDPHSYAAFIRRHLIDPLALDPAQARLWRGDACDADAELRALEATIRAWGGIDLAILGLGRNGHVAFNEPGTPREARAHLAALSDSTRAAARAADGWEAPAEGFTLGLANLLEARRLLLLVAGEGKEEARRALYRGIEDPRWPVTRLLGHPDLTVIELGARGDRP